MVVKLFEIRDRMTAIPAMGIRLEPGSPEEHFLLRRAGFTHSGMTRANDVPPYVILVKLDPVVSQYDPHQWGSDTRTMPTAHEFIIRNWDTLLSGDVVDVEFVLGEAQVPKVSERIDSGGV